MHWSQDKLAQKLGTDIQYISEIENAKRKISIDYIGMLADAFGVTLYEMLVERPPVQVRRIDR